jgi:hypothetical protein
MSRWPHLRHLLSGGRWKAGAEGAGHKGSRGYVPSGIYKCLGSDIYRYLARYKYRMVCTDWIPGTNEGYQPAQKVIFSSSRRRG